MRHEKYYFGKSVPQYRDQMTSAHALPSQKLAVIVTSQPPPPRNRKSPPPVLAQTRKSLENFRQNEETQYRKCLEKTRHLFSSEKTLKRGYINPVDRNTHEILIDLKQKEDLKKNEI